MMFGRKGTSIAERLGRTDMEGWGFDEGLSLLICYYKAVTLMRENVNTYLRY